VKHIELETENEQVKRFVLSLQLDPEGTLLEIGGKPVVRVLPVTTSGVSYEPDKLKAANFARRDECRRLNADWEHVDREAWDKLPPDIA
jgi:hypothetical protein